MGHDNLHSDSWYFYHKKSKKRLGPFSIDAICKLMIENKINLDHILICQPDWKKWKNPIEVMEFLNPYQNILQNLDKILPEIIDENVHDLIPKQRENSKSNLEATVTNITIAPKKIETKAKVIPDTKLELKVIIVAHKKSLRTKTINITRDGLHLSGSLSENFTKLPLDIYLSSPDNKTTIKIKAELISNDESVIHLKFIHENNNSIKSLENWIEILEDKTNSSKQNTDQNLKNFKKSA